MSYQLFVRPEVDADIAEGEVWYEQRAEGLGKDFARTVRDALRELPNNPLIYRLRHRRLGIRWFYPPRFPYRIVYRIHHGAGCFARQATRPALAQTRTGVLNPRTSRDPSTDSAAIRLGPRVTLSGVFQCQMALSGCSKFR